MKSSAADKRSAVRSILMHVLNVFCAICAELLTRGHAHRKNGLRGSGPVCEELEIDSGEKERRHAGRARGDDV